MNPETKPAALGTTMDSSSRRAACVSSAMGRLDSWLTSTSVRSPTRFPRLRTTRTQRCIGQVVLRYFFLDVPETCPRFPSCASVAATRADW